MAAIVSDGILSELPDDIGQKILSSLTLKERAIASLVSIKWHHMIVSLDDRKFMQTHSTNTYCGYCYIYKRPFCSQCSNNLHPVIIKLAADNTTLTEFYLLLPCSYASFKLSPAILESTLLTVLHLRYCVIDENDIKEFPCLKEIYFDRVAISCTTFSILINKCPSIVELTLIYCSSLDSISVPHLNQLKKVHVNYDSRYKHRIEIKARNLQEFHLFNSSAAATDKLDLCACTKLQVLKIDSQYIPFGFPEDISSAFPCLKSLFLRLCKRLNKIKLLSPELESLTLSDMVDLEDAIIVTPNLDSFKLIDMEKVPCSSLVLGSRLMEVEIGLKYNRAISGLLQRLRTYAENFGRNITLSLATNATEPEEQRFHFGNLGSNIRPLCIKHINLVIFFSLESRYELLIDELFSYFRPQTLLVKVISAELNKFKFIQVLLDELKVPEMERGKCYKCNNSYMCWRGKCNKNSNSMCWHYFLKGFKMLESTKKQGCHQISLEFQWSE